MSVFFYASIYTKRIPLRICFFFSIYKALTYKHVLENKKSLGDTYQIRIRVAMLLFCCQVFVVQSQSENRSDHSISIYEQ